MGTEWNGSEEERVARWLQAKVRPKAEEPEPGDDGHDPWEGERDFRAEADPASFDDSPRFEAGVYDDAPGSRAGTFDDAHGFESVPSDDAHGFESVPFDAGWSPTEVLTDEAREARAQLDAEVSELDERRRRLAATFEAERAEAERLRQEQLEARARLEWEVSALDEQRRRLADAFEAQRAMAEQVPRQQLEERERLEAEVAELDEQRHRLAAAFEAERAEAERIRREQLEARARLEEEVLDLDEQRRRLNEAFEALQSAARRVPQDQVEAPRLVAPTPLERPEHRRRPAVAYEAHPAHADWAKADAESNAQLQAEIVQLDEQRRRLSVAVEAERSEVERSHREQEEARQRLAATLAELGQHLAVAGGTELDEREDRPGERRPVAGPEPKPSSEEDQSRQARPARTGTDRGVLFVVKVVVILALVGLVAVEVGSPIAVRSELRPVAAEAAERAAGELVANPDLERARVVAQEIAAQSDALLKSFTVDHGGVHVVLERQAHSWVLKRWATTRGWYDVEVTATAA